nr:hypothetical protein [Bacteroidota bacterium]
MFQHFILTPFSYRDRERVKKKGQDPLNPKSLEHRLNMFEISCMPGILNQEHQDFIWILIVDPALPQKFRNRLKQLISKRPGSYLSDYTPEQEIGKLTWLKQWIKPETEYIVTTKLDDDDALYGGFTKYIFDHFSGLAKTAQIPPMLFYGCKNVVYWDFFWSEKAPLGYQKPWNKTTYPASGGFSLCCKYPELNFSIRSFEHGTFDYLHDEVKIFPLSNPGFEKRIYRRRNMILEAARSSTLAWDGLLRQENFHLLSTTLPQVVMVNHLDNIQYIRLFTNPEKRVPVVATDTFQGFFIDFILAKEFIRKQPRSWRLFFRLLVRHFRFYPDYLKGQNPIKNFVRKIAGIRGIISNINNMY